MLRGQRRYDVGCGGLTLKRALVRDLPSLIALMRPQQTRWKTREKTCEKTALTCKTICTSKCVISLAPMNAPGTVSGSLAQPALGSTCSVP